MELSFRIAFAVALLLAHAPFAVAFLRSIRRRQVPGVLLFAVLGVLLYYDLGFALQSFGWTFPSPYFPSLGSYDVEDFVTVGLVILATPYLLAIGYRAVAGRLEELPAAPTLNFSPRLKPIFLALFLPVCLLLGLVGFAAIRGATSAAEVKLLWVGILGGGYIAFLMPMFVLAFYLRTQDSGTRAGRFIVFFLLAASVSATLFLGQRTMTLLPFLMLALFRARLSTLRLALSIALLFAFASVALVFYKGYAVRQDLDILQRAEMVVGADLVRANVLARAIQESEPLGSRLLPVVGQGYFYTVLFYLPRSWAPHKGYSTAAYFTAFANGEETEFVAWGLGLGFLEEIILNFGFLAVVPGVMLYGFGLGLLERFSAHSAAPWWAPVWQPSGCAGTCCRRWCSTSEQ